MSDSAGVVAKQVQAAQQQLDAVERAGQLLVDDVDGRKVVWRRWGQGAPLLLFHGGGGSWQHWVRNVDALGRERAVWAIDLPGFGDSAAVGGHRDVMAVAQAAAASIDRVFAGQTSLAIAGFSFGGIMAAQVALLRPGRVSDLVIVGSTALGIERPSLAMQSWRGETDPVRRLALHRHNLRTLMLHHHADDDVLALLVHSRNVELGRIDGREVAQSLLLRETLAQVDSRVHGIWGEHDMTTGGHPARALAAMSAAVPSVQFQAIANAGHWVQYEAAAVFNDVLLRMLRRGVPA